MNDMSNHEIRLHSLRLAVDRAYKTNVGAEAVVKEAKKFEDFISGKKGDENGS